MYMYVCGLGVDDISVLVTILILIVSKWYDIVIIICVFTLSLLLINAIYCVHICIYM